MSLGSVLLITRGCDAGANERSIFKIRADPPESAASLLFCAIDKILENRRVSKLAGSSAGELRCRASLGWTAGGGRPYV